MIRERGAVYWAMTVLRYEDILTLKIGLTLRATDDGSAFFHEEGGGMRGSRFGRIAEMMIAVNKTALNGCIGRSTVYSRDTFCFELNPV